MTPAQTGEVTVAVVGAHLDGEPLNHQLTSRGGKLLERTRTAPTYRLFALAETEPAKPALARQTDGDGATIEVELWSLAPDAFAAFVLEIPAPLGMGSLELEDGRWVAGFICEPWGLRGATDITEFGGWRAYLRSRPGR